MFIQTLVRVVTLAGIGLMFMNGQLCMGQVYQTGNHTDQARPKNKANKARNAPKLASLALQQFAKG